MPSQQARQLTSLHRRELGLISTAVTNRVLASARAADVDDIDLWWEQAGPGIAAQAVQGFDLTATLALRYLRRHAATERVALDPVRAEVDRARVSESLRVSGPVAFKTNIRAGGDPLVARRAMSEKLRGAATRIILGGSRDTATATVESADQVAGWRRVTAGSPCAFCAMVASRGAAYKERTGLRAPQFHDHDRCTYEPLYEVEPEPADVVELRRRWDETTDGLSGVDALNAFRRASPRS